MAFPKITFKHTNVEPDYALQAQVTQKLQSLDKFLQSARTVQVEVELELLHIAHTDAVYRVEVNIWRGEVLSRAEAVAGTFIAATELARADLAAELERLHGKRVNIARRAARRFKELMRWR
jgi:ribosomal subunit interface protein